MHTCKNNQQDYVTVSSSSLFVKQFSVYKRFQGIARKAKERFKGVLIFPLSVSYITIL